MPALLTAIYILAFSIVVKLLSKKEGYYSTVCVFGIGCFVYYVGIPLELYILTSEEFIRGRITLSLSTAQLCQIIIMGTAAFLAFSLGYYLSFFNPQNFNHRALDRLSKMPYSMQLICAGSLSLIVIFYHNNILALSTYEAASGVRYNNPAFSLLCTFVVLYGSVMASTSILKFKHLNRYLGWVLILFVFVWGIYTSDKNVILIGLLAVAASSLSFIRKRGFIFLFYIFIGCAALIYGFKVFSVYRGGQDIYSAVSIAGKNFGFRFTDPLGPFASIQHVLKQPDYLQYGKTYLQIFYIIIPKFLWTKRPLGLSEQFARDNIPHWQPGKGMGFSPLAEAYLNFSWMGPLIQYLFLGLLWGYIWRFLRKLLWNFPQELWQSLYYILGYYLLILIHRGTVSGLLKSMILFASVLIIINFFIDLGVIKGLKKSA